MLHICSEHFEQKDEEEKEKDSKDKDKKAEKSDDGSHQGVAVLGIALMGMGEEIGAQMVLRTCNHLVCIKGKSALKTFYLLILLAKNNAMIKHLIPLFCAPIQLFWIVHSIF